MTEVLINRYGTFINPLLKRNHWIDFKDSKISNKRVRDYDVQ